MQAELTPPSGVLAAEARALMRGARTAALSTILSPDQSGGGGPYGSLALSATCPDATPILLLSRLAVHTGNLAHDPRASLLYDAGAGLEDPLTGARLTLTGRIQATAASDIAADKARFLARHPGAAAYADFADFAFYRLLPERAHFVAGFGRINWIAAADLLLPEDQWAALAALEADILAHMNEDHAGSLALYAEKLLGQASGPWRVAGIDPEGCDLRLGSTCVRLPFVQTIRTADQARFELARLARLARAGIVIKT